MYKCWWELNCGPMHVESTFSKRYEKSVILLIFFWNFCMDVQQSEILWIQESDVCRMETQLSLVYDASSLLLTLWFPLSHPTLSFLIFPMQKNLKMERTGKKKEIIIHWWLVDSKPGQWGGVTPWNPPPRVANICTEKMRGSLCLWIIFYTANSLKYIQACKQFIVIHAINGKKWKIVSAFLIS